MGWNVADVWEAVADRFPSSLALVHGDREVTWQPFDERADGVAAALLGAGLSHQDKVAQYLCNGPEYLESMLAAFKAGLVPVNTNYRYADNELRYQLTNSDAASVVFGAAFTAVGARLRASLRPFGCGYASAAPATTRSGRCRTRRWRRRGPAIAAL